MEENVRNALEIAMEYGDCDGAHHKDWVIDQMVRALTNCPLILHDNWEELGESEAYRQFVAEACDGEDGPSTYEWNIGIAP